MQYRIEKRRSPLEYNSLATELRIVRRGFARGHCGRQRWHWHRYCLCDSNTRKDMAIYNTKEKTDAHNKNKHTCGWVIHESKSVHRNQHASNHIVDARLWYST